MIIVRKIEKNEKKLIDEIVDIHLSAFEGFFLSFMGKTFLKNMYLSYVEDVDSDVLVALEDGKPIGFLSYTYDLDRLYKQMAKKHFFALGFSCIAAFVKKPALIFKRVWGFVFGNDDDCLQEDACEGAASAQGKSMIKLSSIGVLPKRQREQIGSILIKELKSKIDFDRYYISLDTDATNNEAAISFYEKNGFVQHRIFTTKEGREMIEFWNK